MPDINSKPANPYKVPAETFEMFVNRGILRRGPPIANDARDPFLGDTSASHENTIRSSLEDTTNPSHESLENTDHSSGVDTIRPLSENMSHSSLENTNADGSLSRSTPKDTHHLEPKSTLPPTTEHFLSRQSFQDLYASKKRKISHNEASGKDSGKGADTWVDATKRLIANGARAEKEHQELVDATLAYRAEVDKTLKDLTSAVSGLDSALQRLVSYTPFQNVMQTVVSIMDDHNNDAAGVQEVTKELYDTINRKIN
jgi:hypothetical protein